MKPPERLSRGADEHEGLSTAEGGSDHRWNQLLAQGTALPSEPRAEPCGARSGLGCSHPPG